MITLPSSLAVFDSIPTGCRGGAGREALVRDKCYTDGPLGLVPSMCYVFLEPDGIGEEHPR